MANIFYWRSNRQYSFYGWTKLLFSLFFTHPVDPYPDYCVLVGNVLFNIYKLWAVLIKMVDWSVIFWCKELSSILLWVVLSPGRCGKHQCLAHLRHSRQPWQILAKNTGHVEGPEPVPDFPDWILTVRWLDRTTQSFESGLFVHMY